MTRPVSVSEDCQTEMSQWKPAHREQKKIYTDNRQRGRDGQKEKECKENVKKKKRYESRKGEREKKEELKEGLKNLLKMEEENEACREGVKSRTEENPPRRSRLLLERTREV